MIRILRLSDCRSLLLAACVLIAGCGERSAQDVLSRSTPPVREVVLFAAASTAEAVEEVRVQFEQEHHCQIQLNLGSSAALARQITQGARADLFLSASEEWAADLRQRGLVEREKSLLGNSLVIVVPADSSITIASPKDLLSAKVRRLALADPESVPAGKYARQALVALDLWEKLKPKVVAGDDVRQALIYVERGETEAGIVYATDASITRQVRVVATIDPKLSGPIRYPLLLLKQRQPELSQALFEYFSTPQATEVFRARGFSILTPE